MKILFGKQEYKFKLPDSWRVLNSFNRKNPMPLSSLKEEIISSIKKPLGSVPLKELLAKGERVLILIDDQTRSTPVKEVLEIILPLIKEQAINKLNINILICGGTHRLMTDNEIWTKTGKEVFEKYPIHQHDAFSSNLVSIKPIIKNNYTLDFKINPLIKDAQIIIGIGSIFPHHQSGFSGGPKIVCPGICDYTNIVAHHRIFGYQRGAAHGVLDDNLFYEISCAVAGQAGLSFIINTVCNEKGEILGVFSGNPFKAHREGASFIENNFAVRFSEKADITIISAYPYLRPPQNFKAIGVAAKSTKKGGTIILLSPGHEIPKGVWDKFVFFNKQTDSEIFEIYNKNEIPFPGLSVLENYNIPRNVLYSRQFKIIYVNPKEERNKLREIGFIPAESISGALELEKKDNRSKKIVLLNQGVLSYPLLENS